MVDPATINHMVDPATINHMVDPATINQLVDPATINHLVDGIKINQLGGERNFAPCKPLFDWTLHWLRKIFFILAGF